MTYRAVAIVVKYLAVAAVFFSAACSDKATIEMDNKVPPTFTFQKNRDHVYFIPIFSVVEIDQTNSDISSARQEKTRTIWQIEPPLGAEREIDKLPPITYGRIPPGFGQIVPRSGLPPPLVEGKTYEAGGPAVMVPHGVIRFTIRNGKAVRVPMPATARETVRTRL